MGTALYRTARGLFIAFTLLIGVVSAGLAQETGQIGRITITDSNTESAPSVQLPPLTTGFEPEEHRGSFVEASGVE